MIIKNIKNDSYIIYIYLSILDLCFLSLVLKVAMLYSTLILALSWYCKFLRLGYYII